MERKLGEIFTCDGKTYQVVKGITCDGCCFFVDDDVACVGGCCSADRSDHKNVIFKEVNE